MARLLLIGCQTLADDEGLLRWDPDELHALLFDSDPEVTASWVMSWMAHLVDAHLVLPYRGGRHQVPLAYLRDFERDQKVARPKTSRFAAPDPRSPRFAASYALRDGSQCAVCTGPVFLSAEVAHIAQAMSGSPSGEGLDSNAAPQAVAVTRTVLLGLDLSEAPLLLGAAQGGDESHPSKVSTAHAACVDSATVAHALPEVAEVAGLVSRWHFWRVHGRLFDTLHDESTLREAVAALHREAVPGAAAGTADLLGHGVPLAGHESAHQPESKEEQDQPFTSADRQGAGRLDPAMEPTRDPDAEGPSTGPDAAPERPVEPGWGGHGGIVPDTVPAQGSPLVPTQGTVSGPEGTFSPLGSVALPDPDIAGLPDSDTVGLTESSVSPPHASVSALHGSEPHSGTNGPLTCENSTGEATHPLFSESSATAHAPFTDRSHQEVEVEREVERELGDVNASRSQNARGHIEHPPPSDEPPTRASEACAFGAPQEPVDEADENQLDRSDPSEADALVEGNSRSIDEKSHGTIAGSSPRSITDHDTEEGDLAMSLPVTAPRDHAPHPASEPGIGEASVTEVAPPVVEEQGGLFDMEPVDQVEKPARKRKQPATWTEERKQAAHAILKPWWETHGQGWPQTYGAVFGVLIAAMKNGVSLSDLTEAMDILGNERMAIGGGSIAVAMRKAAKRREDGSFVRDDDAYTSAATYSYRELD